MVICYFIIFWLMFFSGIFYYPESHEWVVEVVLLSIISGILVTVVSATSAQTVDKLMNYDPYNGGYLVLTIAVSVLLVTLLAVYISQKILHFYILPNSNLVGVFMYIIYPAVFLTFISQATKRLDV